GTGPNRHCPSGGALRDLPPIAFFGCDSASDRSEWRVRPGACNGTHPLLSRSGNRANSAGGGKLGTSCAALADRGQRSEVRGRRAESEGQSARGRKTDNIYAITPPIVVEAADCC